MIDYCAILNVWTFEIWTPHGKRRYRRRFKNAIPTTALTDAAAVLLGAGTQKTTWYGGLIDDDGFDELAAADTIGSHPGWTEFTDYDEATRQLWTPGTPSGGIITNPTAMRFTVTNGATVTGAILVSNSTKGGSTGLLWATGPLPVKQILIPGELVRVYYQLTVANG
jgi:hypothetical protein